MQMLGFEVDLAPDPVRGFALEESILAAPIHTSATLLLDCWRDGERNGGFTVGRDFPSRKLARILANLVLYEYSPVAQDFRVRVAGFSLMRRFGRDITRRYLRDILPGEHHGRHLAAMIRVMETGVPYSVDAKLKLPELPALRYETLTVDARAADGKGRLVLSGLFFFDGRRHRAAVV